MNVKLKKRIAALTVAVIAFVYIFVCVFYIYNIKKIGGDNLQNLVVISDETNEMLKDNASRESEIIFFVSNIMEVLAFAGIIEVLVFAGIIEFIILGRKTKNFENVENNKSSNKGELLYSTDMFSEFANDIENMKNSVLNGTHDFKIDENKYTGMYKNTALYINEIIDSMSKNIEDIKEAILKLSEGDFNYIYKEEKGNFSDTAKAFEKLRQNILDVNELIKNTADSIKRGELDFKLDDSKYDGYCEDIALELNDIFKYIKMPVTEIIRCLSETSKANFNGHADENCFNGKFKDISVLINRTNYIISDYITEISQILNSISVNNLNVKFENEYMGNFAELKNVLEIIINNFNSLVEEIRDSAYSVSAGAKSISDSAGNLAEGVTEQASAVDELTEVIANVASHARKNTLITVELSEITEEAKKETENITIQMQSMLNAMNEINNASNDISNIIKTIDDIAFQTNLLALNAAVEAARAGEHGKGFAVVAEEVRNLAARSKKSARDTDTLISASIEKAEQGSEIAEATTKSIETITSRIEKIADISKEVAEISEMQNKAIEEINIGINQISKVVSSNTATSEESASAASDLAGRSANFESIVARFKLRK